MEEKLLDQLLENSQKLNDLITEKTKETTFAKLEKRLQEQEDEKELNNEVKKIISEMIF